MHRRFLGKVGCQSWDRGVVTGLQSLSTDRPVGSSPPSQGCKTPLTFKLVPFHS